MWNKINIQSKNLLEICRLKNLTISTVESCTGGMLASSIIHNPGSSNIFGQGLITYSNKSKHKELKISIETLNKFGAVSDVVAEQMLMGILNKTKSSIGISTTGIAGPDGGSTEKPIGLVWISVGNNKERNTSKFLLTGNRLDIRLKTTLMALQSMNDFINKLTV